MDFNQKSGKDHGEQTSLEGQNQYMLVSWSLEALACSMYNFQIRALLSGPWNVTHWIFGS
jgi:hypothetical protein